MIENYLGYLEICTQLYTTNNSKKEVMECFEKYHNLLEQEYSQIPEEEKIILKEVINSKIENLKTEKSSTMMAQLMVIKDSQLNSIFPGHIKAQYSDKLKKYEKELHFLQSIYLNMNISKGVSK